MYHWENVTPQAAFAPRDGAGSLVFKDKMWLLGGWNPNDKEHFPLICNSEVWSSEDGANWKLEVLEAPWEPRHCAGYVVHNDRMWILGGDTNQKHHQNDIWSSADGVHWEKVMDFAPWAPRNFQYCVTFQGKMWVMGGQTLLKHAKDAPEINYNDVWCSEDGLHWEQVLEEAPWSPRGMIGGGAVFNGRIWLLGGATYENPVRSIRWLFREVWSTADGVNWIQHKEPAWLNRQFHEVAVYDNKLWVLEGSRFNYDKWPNGMGDNSGNLNDVWYSADGEEWHEIPDTPWAERHAASVYVYKDALWMVAGNNLESDVWKLTRTSSE